MAPIVCRGCGASSSKGDQFSALEFITVTDYHLVVPSFDGLESVEILESGVGPTPAGRPLLECRSCGHQWTTTRDIDWMGQR